MWMIENSESSRCPWLLVVANGLGIRAPHGQRLTAMTELQGAHHTFTFLYEDQLISLDVF